MQFVGIHASVSQSPDNTTVGVSRSARKDIHTKTGTNATKLEIDSCRFPGNNTESCGQKPLLTFNLDCPKVHKNDELPTTTQCHHKRRSNDRSRLRHRIRAVHSRRPTVVPNRPNRRPSKESANFRQRCRLYHGGN